MSNALRRCKDNWERLGAEDPLWAVLTEDEKSGGRWCLDDFLATGEGEVSKILHIVAQHGLTLQYAKALDFGCGVGRLTHALADRFDEALGVDIAESMVAKARELHAAKDNCRFYVNNEQHLRKFPDESFDFILSIITLQHMPPVAAYTFVGEFARLLKPGATAVFQAPTGYAVPVLGPLLRHVPSALFHYYRKLKYANKAVMDMHVLDEKTLQRILERGSCRIVRTLPSESAGPPFDDKLFLIEKGQGV
jgi:ubiquinone/menaquinone biosynthesis C-methylase UbiE